VIISQLKYFIEGNDLSLQNVKRPTNCGIRVVGFVDEVKPIATVPVQIQPISVTELPIWRG
jgi:hypothetical protein